MAVAHMGMDGVVEGHAEQAYKRAVHDAYEARCRAIRAAQAAYEEAAAPFAAAYQQALHVARSAYDRSLAPLKKEHAAVNYAAEKIYDRAVADAWVAFDHEERHGGHEH